MKIQAEKNTPAISSKIHLLNQDYQNYINRKTPEGESFHRFICQKLYQFGLDTMQAEDIKVEVYLRARDAILVGKELFNLQGWLRSCGYNIVRERKRSQQKNLAFKEEISGMDESDLSETNDSIMVDEEREYNYKLIKKAFLDLSEWEQKLIRLKELKNLSWDQIHQVLLLETGHHYSIQSLRKRKSRALQKLREKLKHLKLRD